MLELFKYEMANLLADQADAELGDHKRGLGSGDLPAIQSERVPCLLNAAACRLRLAESAGDPDDVIGAQTVGGQTTAADHCTHVLELLGEVHKAGARAPARAKAHYRAAQAHCLLGNWREAWEAAGASRALQPASAEARALQQRAQQGLRAVQRAEAASARNGATASEGNRDIVEKEVDL